MTDNIPDNVDLAWIARHVVTLRDELRANTRSLQTLRDDVDIMAAILRRVDNNQTVNCTLTCAHAWTPLKGGSNPDEALASGCAG